MYKLEVIGFNIASCIVAQAAGAHRIELCDNPKEGGTTPSYGFIRKARENLSIDLYVMIRPRGGDFIYSEEEFSIMQQDVEICKQLGCNGIVMGILDADGSINKDQCNELVEMAYPMRVTFHRAFDHSANPFQALEEIIDIGCERILTSGQKPTALEGEKLIHELIRQANERIIIMPGSGVRSENVMYIAEHTGATEFHTSARKAMHSEMRHFNLDLEEDTGHVMADEPEIKSMVSQLKKLGSV
jgi:copper homeostasis protein